MGRLMAIDYGRKRCGIAVTDVLRLAGNALATVRACDLEKFVKDYLSKESVDRIIVGYPRTLRGEPSESVRWLAPAIERLRRAVTPVEIEFYDERFTSSLAHRAMLDGGLKRSDRQDKETVDRVAAAIILNDYLQSINNL